MMLKKGPVLTPYQNTKLSKKDWAPLKKVNQE